MVNEKVNKISQSKKILDAAYKCVSTRGYANVSLRDIADEAGVVLSQLNYYYKNKEGLFEEVIKRFSNQYLHDLEQWLKRGKDAKERIDLLVAFYKNILVEKTDLFKVLFDLTSLALWSDSFGKLLQELFRNASAIIENYIISDAEINKNLIHYSSSALARLVFGALFGISTQLIFNTDGNDDTIPQSLDIIGKVLLKERPYM